MTTQTNTAKQKIQGGSRQRHGRAGTIPDAQSTATLIRSSINYRSVKADTDDRPDIVQAAGTHHPAGPMVSALTRALSVSLSSSSIACLGGFLKWTIRWLTIIIKNRSVFEVQRTEMVQRVTEGAKVGQYN